MMKNLRDLIEPGRPRPLYNGELHRYSLSLIANGHEANSDTIGERFKIEFDRWLHSSKINNLKGLDAFEHRDVIQGVTGFIDDVYQMHRGTTYTIDKDYMYHQRLYGRSTVANDIKDVPDDSKLIVSMPFPFLGDVHPDMATMLDDCLERNISVYIDSAWIGCTRDLEFDYDHPAIHSIGFSLSKGLGLGYSRIGVRYSRARDVGPITIMNDFTMIPRTMCWWGLKFMERFEHDYLQIKYHDLYVRLCKECELIPSKSIHLAHVITNGNLAPVGTREALRYLDENKHL